MALSWLPPLLASVALFGCSDVSAGTFDSGAPVLDGAVEGTPADEVELAAPPEPAAPAPHRVYWLDADYNPVVAASRIAGFTAAERAAVAFVASTVGNACQTERAEAAFDTWVVRCALTDALSLGEQCGQRHHRFMKEALGPDLPEWCYGIPITTYFRQTALSWVDVRTTGTTITVEYAASGTTGPGGNGWEWRETLELRQLVSGELRLRRRARSGDPPAPDPEL